jgi:hypothetical protein
VTIQKTNAGSKRIPGPGLYNTWSPMIHLHFIMPLLIQGEKGPFTGEKWTLCVPDEVRVESRVGQTLPAP